MLKPITLRWAKITDIGFRYKATYRGFQIYSPTSRVTPTFTVMKNDDRGSITYIRTIKDCLLFIDSTFNSIKFID